jgi:hypothetical protein
MKANLHILIIGKGRIEVNPNRIQFVAPKLEVTILLLPLFLRWEESLLNTLYTPRQILLELDNEIIMLKRVLKEYL